MSFNLVQKHPDVSYAAFGSQAVLDQSCSQIQQELTRMKPSSKP